MSGLHSPICRRRFLASSLAGTFGVVIPAARAQTVIEQAAAEILGTIARSNFKGRNIAVARTHQPGEAAFRSVLPEDIDWKPFPAFPLRSALPSSSASRPSPAPT